MFQRLAIANLHGSRILVTVSCLMLVTRAAPGQAAPSSTSHLSFEVASIRPVGPIERGALLSDMNPPLSIDGHQVYVGSMSLMELICQAFEVSRNRIIGGAAWLGREDAQRFAIVAKMPEGASTAQAPEMLQALLAARFQLVVGREKRKIPVYALVVAKSGPHLAEEVPLPPVLASADK